MSYTSEIADGLGEVINADPVTVTHSSGTFTARVVRGVSQTHGMAMDGYLPHGPLQIIATATALTGITIALENTLAVAGVTYRVAEIKADASATLFKCNRQN